MADKVTIDIEYCVPCNYLPRATWVAQEILTTFPVNVASVKLVASRGGRFEVSVDGELVFSTVQMGRFPEIQEIREKIRDKLS